jgi:hypothetical protein
MPAPVHVSFPTPALTLLPPFESLDGYSSSIKEDELAMYNYSYPLENPMIAKNTSRELYLNCTDFRGSRQTTLHSKSKLHLSALSLKLYGKVSVL